MGPINKYQLFKIQEILQNPTSYRNKLPKDKQPVTGEYAKAFSKFFQGTVEVNETTMEGAAEYGRFIKKCNEEMAESIDLYKQFNNDIYYGPENQKSGPSDE